jgi:hypothetical protein
LLTFTEENKRDYKTLAQMKIDLQQMNR